MDALLKASAGEMARAVRDREVSPAELVAAQIARIEALNPALNAIVVPRFEAALDEARTVGDGPLRGVPFTVKEAIPVAGLPCTAGAQIFAANVPDRDAVVVQRLRDAGAILVG